VSHRVLLMVSPLDGSGPGRVMTTLAEQLTARGVDTLLVATHGPDHSPLIEEARASGVEVVNLRMRAMVDPSGVAAFIRLLRRWRPTVVHTRTVRADLIGRVAAASGIPVINNIVNLYPDDCLVRLGPVVGRATMSLLRLTRGSVRLFVTNAQAVSANTQVAFHAPPDRVEVVYDGLELEPWTGASPADLSSYGIGSQDAVCLTVARLHPQKGLDDLVEAARKVRAQQESVRFVIAGDGPTRGELERQISSSGLSNHIILLGERRDIPSLLARCSLFVLPSRFEGFPAAVIEAMAARRAVVATGVAGTPELVQHGVTGWIVPPGSPAELAEAILAALGRDLKPLGEAGRLTVEERFSAAAMTDAFLASYRAVSGGHDADSVASG
jgi:glycosyltransferase involved in cell wall biosynthesis